MTFIRFMAGPAGRVVRIVAGLALMLVGLFVVGKVAGVALAALGLVPVAAGLFNFCLFAPLFGGPFMGREALEHR